MTTPPRPYFMTARRCSFRRPFASLTFLLLVASLAVVALLRADRLRAQSQAELPSYWQYATSGRLTHLASADVNADGVDEFIVADDNNHVDLISAAGKQVWTFVAPDRVTAVAAFISGSGPDLTTGILVGLPNQMILLNAQGEELWRTEVNPLDTPTTLRGSGSKPADSQLEGYEYLPIDIAPYDHDGDGEDGILTLLQSGELLLFDSSGAQIWGHSEHPSEGVTAAPMMLLSDLDQDGQDEIVLAIYDPRRFGQLVLIDDGLALWDISLSRQITDLIEITFEPGGEPLIAASTSLGHVYTFDYARERRWLRTLNKPVTALAQVSLSDHNELALGTSAGTVMAYDGQGRRVWTNQLTTSPDEPVLFLGEAPANLNNQQPSLLATVESSKNEGLSADAYLLDNTGQALSKISNVDTQGLTKLADSNHDTNGELMVAHFAMLEMLGLGVGNTGNVQEWEYSLNAAPAAAVVADLDGDGSQEMVIGTTDGRIHNLNSDRSIRWLLNAGGAIDHLALLPRVGGTTQDIIIAGRDTPGSAQAEAWLQLRDPQGERMWEQRFDSPLTTIIAADVLSGPGNEIVAANEIGEILVLSDQGEMLRRVSGAGLSGAIQHLVYLPGSGERAGEIVAAAGRQIIAYDPVDAEAPLRPIVTLDDTVVGVFRGATAGEQEIGVWLLALTTNGRLHGLNWRGIEMAQWQWPQTLGGVPATVIALIPAEDPEAWPDRTGLLYATESGQLSLMTVQENRPLMAWQLPDMGRVTAVHAYDQDRDGWPDLILSGNRDGRVSILAESGTEIPQPLSAPLSLSSAVFKIDTVRRGVGQTPDIMAITENGLVQLFRDQENRPPLLTNPVVESDRGQYSISVAVNDVEGDEVQVDLQVQDAQNGVWLDQGGQRLADGFGTLFWALPAPPAGPLGLNYRFQFSDGAFAGSMTPPPGPASAAVSPLEASAPALAGGALLLGLLAVIAVVRQTRTPGARAVRFYRNLHLQPQRRLPLFEQQAQANNLQDLMPYLASHARQEEDRTTANLADGLFLLTDQPQSGLAIVMAVLNDMQMEPDSRAIVDLDRWAAMFSAGQALLEAASIGELVSLHSNLEQLAGSARTGTAPAVAVSLLGPILSSLQDSERVSMVEDRLVYLNEAGNLITKAQARLPVFTPSLEKLLTTVLLRRWAGLVSAEIEDLRGRAELTVTLKTRRLVPSEDIVLAFEISNNGRSAAENILATLDADPAYRVISPPQALQLLPPGRTREIRFSIDPQVSDRFRIGLTVTFSDRNRTNRRLAFGDMVYLLQPAREFAPIPNPYTPGTALRPDSMLFFGRDDLFSFISENAGRRSYRNVLILVGQRRTGKTSALLRLEHNLPSHLLPVYIDCQSLGVVPGMPALLEELAWYIADALAHHGITVDVPTLDEWQRDPTRLFQRRFLPMVNALLPDGTTLLLVFDEFEAFENLVADGILPPTFFSYLRHLMQHGEQLNFIFVGTRRLEEMTSDYWSVLFNIALYRKITFLDKEAAMRLITEPVAPFLVYDDLALDKILRVTAGHPYFLQLVCYTLVKRANSRHSSYTTISDVNAAVEEMLMLGEVHFAYLWQRSSLNERTVLTAVAHLMDPNLPFSPEELLARLRQYDIHLGVADVAQALTSLVERDILQEITAEAKTLYELRLGLVGLWVARNKSLSKLFAHSVDSYGVSTLPNQTVSQRVETVAD